MDVEVTAGGRIAHARDAWQYVPVPRSQAEIQTDKPMWLLQLRGTLRFPTGSPAPADAGVLRNPVCTVLNGGTGYFDVSGADASGVTKSLPPPEP